MPTNFRTLGPVEHFFRPFGTTSFLYLGTAVTSPMMKHGNAFLPVWNDIGGRSVETQLVADRRKSVIVTTLNRFNWTNYNTLRRMTGDPGSALYQERPVDHGVLALGNAGFDVDLLLAFTFGNAAGFPSDNPNGRLYYGCVLKDFEESPANSRVVELTLTFENYGRLDPTTRTFSKFTETPSAWGSVTPE